MSQDQGSLSFTGFDLSDTPQPGVAHFSPVLGKVGTTDVGSGDTFQSYTLHAQR